MSSDDEPVFRSMKDAKDDVGGMGIMKKAISKKKKKTVEAKPIPQPEPKKDKVEPEKPKPSASVIDKNILSILEEEIPTSKIKAVEREKEKAETQLAKLRKKGETKQVILEKEAKKKIRFVDDFEVVLVKKDYVHKGNPEHIKNLKDFQNKLFNRRELNRVPLSKILAK